MVKAREGSLEYLRLKSKEYEDILEIKINSEISGEIIVYCKKGSLEKVRDFELNYVPLSVNCVFVEVEEND